MGKSKSRRKNRTHFVDNGPTKGPSSFIIKHGKIGTSLARLVRELRRVMEPNTAARLKERNRNKLKDYLNVAPSLHVTHLLAFTLTPLAPSMRLIRLSDGPTLSFRVERYSLAKDVLGSKKRARSVGLEYLTPPLLVLSSFPPASPNTPPHLTLLMKSFQSLFPPLSPKTVSLSSARRVVLISYNAERETVDFRHYLITVKPYGVSSRVRRVLEGKKQGSSSTKLVDLGNEVDVADYLLRQRGEAGPDGDGYESSASTASSVVDPEEDTVSLADNYVGRNNKRGQRKAVRLDEIGPRMELSLLKITEGIPGKEGNVIYHRFVKKSAKEAAALKAAAKAKAKLRKERREQQEKNVARKKKLAEGDASGEEEDGDEAEAEDNGDEGQWDGDEEISDGAETESEDEEPEPQRPSKRSKPNTQR